MKASPDNLTVTGWGGREGGRVRKGPRGKEEGGMDEESQLTKDILKRLFVSIDIHRPCICRCPLPSCRPKMRLCVSYDLSFAESRQAFFLFVLWIRAGEVRTQSPSGAQFGGPKDPDEHSNKGTESQKPQQL